ncbi:hypothetical protein DICVIV_08866 [Dictyocaulus viviparus]|uniref:MSP domain-containing protein n=1 Tax=Dictyocaulus viviparus TaxID=29172 RepID=A0A0D8XRR5_DICVI|nr:hypothetical protein DICVIV_08866 [Dictyocaulus viviparus]
MKDEGHIRLVCLDQKYIVFDVDQESNATEVVHISRLAMTWFVAFRFQTNAPTRYLVKPNSGVLENNQPVAQKNMIKVKIELYGNRYNPNHILFVEATVVRKKSDWKKVWEDEDLGPHNVQRVYFQLSTTVIGVDRALQFTDTTERTKAVLTQILAQSNAKGQEKVKELESFYEVLKSDNELLQHNIEQTLRLKNIIMSQINQRNDIISKHVTQTSKLEQEENQLMVEINNMEHEIQQIYERFHLNDSRCI